MLGLNIALFLVLISLIVYLYVIIDYDLATVTDPLQIERFVNQVPNLPNSENIAIAEKFYGSLNNYFNYLVEEGKMTSDQSDSILSGILGIALQVKGLKNSPINWNDFLQNYYYSTTPPNP